MLTWPFYKCNIWHQIVSFVVFYEFVKVLPPTWNQIQIKNLHGTKDLEKPWQLQTCQQNCDLPPTSDTRAVGFSFSPPWSGKGGNLESGLEWEGKGREGRGDTWQLDGQITPCLPAALHCVYLVIHTWQRQRWQRRRQGQQPTRPGCFCLGLITIHSYVSVILLWISVMFVAVWQLTEGPLSLVTKIGALIEWVK